MFSIDIAQLVVVTNLMLRFFIVWMISFIRYKNSTTEKSFIKKNVFYAMFFNSGFVILFATFGFS